MSVFDLLFLLAALASAVALVAATFFAVRGPRRRALNILRVYGICVLAYLTVGVATAFLRPQRVMATRDPWCFDDWCLTVEQVSQTTSQQDIRYRVELRIFSRARRAAQRASGAWIYLIDDQGRRYSPDPDPSAVPLDILLQPHESVTTSRTFRVSADVHGLGLLTGHGGSYCGPMAFLIIGESGCLFKKPAMIRIQ
jgi:hypothetical protein